MGIYRQLTFISLDFKNCYLIVSKKFYVDIILEGGI